MHRKVIGWVILGGRHCHRANIFTCPSRESNHGCWIYRQTLPRHCKSWLLPQGSRNVLYLDPVTFASWEKFSSAEIFFFKINFQEKLFQNYPQGVKQFEIQIRPDFLLAQTVCKG